MQFSQHGDSASGQNDFLTYSIYRVWSLLFTILLTITTIQIKLSLTRPQTNSDWDTVVNYRLEKKITVKNEYFCDFCSIFGLLL